MEKQSPFLAFNYMFKDNKFAVKFGFLFVMTFFCLLPSMFSTDTESLTGFMLSQVVVGITICIQVLYYGYLSAGVTALSEQKENYILPFFNFKTHGMIGLKWFCASLLFFLAVFVALLVLVIIAGLSSIISPIIGIIIGVVTIIPYIIICFVYGMAAFRRFAVTEDVFALFRIKEIFKSVSENAKNYFIHLGVFLLLIIPFVMMTVLFSLLFVVPSLINQQFAMFIFSVIISLLGAYANMCFMYICAKCIK